jgi:DNA mismatch endonuclease (patch repair protein)
MTPNARPSIGTLQKQIQPRRRRQQTIRPPLYAAMTHPDAKTGTFGAATAQLSAVTKKACFLPSHGFNTNFVSMDVLTAEQRTKNMKAIRSKNTKMEVFLAKALWAKGIRYRKNDKSVFGKPDLTIKKYKIAIFIDSEYFHGKDWEIEKHRIKTNREFWWKKIEENQKRDKTVNKFLVDKDWKVLRFWSQEVRKKLNLCIDEIVTVINEQKNA